MGQGKSTGFPCCCTSTSEQPEIKQSQGSSVAESSASSQSQFKLLLLGAGESGKSTLVKQLIFINSASKLSQTPSIVSSKDSSSGPSPLLRASTEHAKISTEDKDHSVTHDDQAKSHQGRIMSSIELASEYVKVLRDNTVQSMQSLLQEAINSKVDLGDQKCLVDEIVALNVNTSINFTLELAQAIQTLWTKCPAITTIWQRRSTFWVLECANYYFTHCIRFAQPNFQPTEEDVIMARKRTTGVVTTDFQHHGVRWSVIDVGGQRNERRKWLHYFDNVQAIIYVANLAAYHRVLFEDQKVNAMQEDIELFRQTAGNVLFKGIPVFLVLNKRDLFCQQLDITNIDHCFPDYDGPADFDPCVKYIEAQFKRQLPSGKSLAGSYYISARSRDDVQDTFDKIRLHMVETIQSQGPGSPRTSQSPVKVVTLSDSSITKVVVTPVEKTGSNPSSPSVRTIKTSSATPSTTHQLTVSPIRPMGHR